MRKGIYTVCQWLAVAWIVLTEISVLIGSFSKYKVLSAIWVYAEWHINPLSLLAYLPAALLFGIGWMIGGERQTGRAS